jgi:hypothetical protein
MKKRRDIKFCFLLSDEEKQKLDALAEDQGRSAAGAIRHIIQRSACALLAGGIRIPPAEPPKSRA